MTKFPIAFFVCVVILAMPAPGDSITVRDSVAYAKMLKGYGTFIDGVDFKNGRSYVILKNKHSILWDDGQKQKNPHQKLNHPDLQDQFDVTYPAGKNASRNKLDPGRVRHTGFLKQIYGKTPSAVSQNLVRVRWFKNRPKILFNKVNGASKALINVGSALNKLPLKYKKYIFPLGGTYKWRTIAGTKRLSAHSFGIAVDLNVQKSAYWQWAGLVHPINGPKKNFPQKIVQIFEAQGFIWGGRWYHYDTMHFEYRPEFF